MSFRVIIAGNREWGDFGLIERFCDKVLSRKIEAGEDITILSGHCRGVDLLGERYARARGFQVECYPADWEKYGRKAGVIRNEIMVQRADALIAIWDGQSRGTKNVIELAEKYGLLVRVRRA